MKKKYGLYLTEEEYRKLRQYAEYTGRSFSQFLRFCALTEYNRHKPKEACLPAQAFTSDGSIDNTDDS